MEKEEKNYYEEQSKENGTTKNQEVALDVIKVIIGIILAIGFFSIIF